jgi:hypothetical protein
MMHSFSEACPQKASEQTTENKIIKPIYWLEHLPMLRKPDDFPFKLRQRTVFEREGQYLRD